MKLTITLILLIQAVFFTTYSQRIENITTEFDGDRIIINYDLSAAKQDDKFNVVLKSSHDNYLRPIKFLMGDAGTNVLPGNKNRIIWDVKNELPADFNGSITIKFEIEILRTVMIEEKSPLSAKPLYKNTFKRGSELRVDWTGGPKEGNVKLDLFRSNAFKGNIVEAGPETKNFLWNIPKKLASGEYFIRVSDANGTETASTQLFKIKPRTPLLLKILPFAAVGAGVFLLLPDKESDLPEPIGPPSN